MTWSQIAFSSLLAATLVVAWSRYSLERRVLSDASLSCTCGSSLSPLVQGSSNGLGGRGNAPLRGGAIVVSQLATVCRLDVEIEDIVKLPDQ